jgi:putative oxidoreductase
MEALGLSWAPMLLSILRIMSGLLLLEHGTGKWLKFPAGVVPATFNVNSMAGYAGVIELVGGLLLVLGLFTRPAAFIVSGMCAVGYFLVHAPNGFFPILNKGELVALYCFVFLYIAAAGPGPWSLDALRRK